MPFEDSIKGSPEPAEQDYSITVTAILPGRQKVDSYTFTVKATCNLEALAAAEEEWKRATEPRDVRVKLQERKE